MHCGVSYHDGLGEQGLVPHRCRAGVGGSATGGVGTTVSLLYFHASVQCCYISCVPCTITPTMGTNIMSPGGLPPLNQCRLLRPASGCCFNSCGSQRQASGTRTGFQLSWRKLDHGKANACKLLHNLRFAVRAAVVCCSSKGQHCAVLAVIMITRVAGYAGDYSSFAAASQCCFLH